MKASTLTVADLLVTPPDGGTFTFAGDRVLLMDAVALGLLRQQLIDSLGFSGARAIFMRFGYGHGWRLAQAMRHTIQWDDESEWRRAGGRLHRLHGLVTFEPVSESQRASPPAFAESVWHDSYEAEQHLLHNGQATECVCWSLVGFASGYSSFVNERPIICVETSCRGKGDSVCRMVGRFKEDWPEAVQREYEFLEKNCLNEELQNLSSKLKRVDRKLQTHLKQLERITEDESGLVYRSDAMQTLVTQARRVAAVDSTVLLIGESGSGKERIAHFMHEHSPRQAGPFIAMNCAAIPESLLESELFGHARGSFTGATTDRPGLFEAAHQGTLMLDEIAEMPLPMQAKLLRVLQEREVRRIGENKNRRVDVRVIAATHRDLKTAVGEGRFREDLYYRLHVVELKVPALRDRDDDILPLAQIALVEAAARMKVPVEGLSAEASRLLTRYGWPGNVRELINAMERALILSSGRQIQPEDLPEEIVTRSKTVSVSAASTLADAEREFILQALRREDGNRHRAAKRLDIGPATLFRKIQQFKQAGYDVP